MSTNRAVAVAFERIFRLWTERRDGYYYRCLTLFYSIIAELQERSGSYLPREQTRKIEKGVEYRSLRI